MTIITTRQIAPYMWEVHCKGFHDLVRLVPEGEESYYRASTLDRKGERAFRDYASLEDAALAVVEGDTR